MSRKLIVIAVAGGTAAYLARRAYVVWRTFGWKLGAVLTWRAFRSSLPVARAYSADEVSEQVSARFASKQEQPAG